MKCGICRIGDTRPGAATVTMQRREATIIIRGVPADICVNCGEYYLSEPVTGAKSCVTRPEEGAGTPGWI